MRFGLQERTVEVKRRREYQLAINKKYHIIPKSIHKPIREKLIEKEEEPKYSWMFGGKPSVYDTLPDIDMEALTPMEKNRLVRTLKTEMRLAAQDLNFELAAEIRDKIRDVA